MAGNKEERMDVVLTAIFQNTEQPANWDKPFDWKPSISIQFKRINNRFQEGEEVIKARASGVKNLWVFEAMGGKNAKGHYFDLLIESGETNGTAWKSFKPLGELFKDGTSRRILEPEEEKPLDGPSEKTKAARASTAPPPAAPPPAAAKAAAPAAAPAPAHKSTANGDKLPPIAATFLDEALFVPQSDAWWKMKDVANMDGAIISNSFHYAAITCGKDATEEAILKQAAWYESMIRQTQFQRRRERFTMMLGLCTTEKQVTQIVNLGWSALPKSHYEPLKESARARLEIIKGGATAPEAVTPIPEAPEEDQPKEGGTDGNIPEEIPF